MSRLKEISTISPITEISTSNSNILPPAPYSQLYWIISEAVLTIVSILLIYLLICLIIFGVKNGCRPGSELRGKKGSLLYQMLLVSVTMAVGRCLSDQTVAFLGWQTDINCQVTTSISFVLYSLSLYPVYIFLWLRQSIFYSSPVLTSVLKPFVTVLSWAVLVAMIVGGAIITVCYVLPEVTGWIYSASPTGCRDISDESDFEPIPAILACFTILINVFLLLLFVYPLVSKKTLRYREKRKSKAKSNEIPPEPHAENSSNAFTNDQFDGDSNNGVLDVNGAVDSIATPEETSSCKGVDKENGTTVGYNPEVLYRNPESKGSKKEKEQPKSKNSSFTFTNRVKCNVRQGFTSSGSYRNTNRRSSSSKTHQGRRVMRFIRKAFFLALICVVSDLIFAIIQLIVIERELVYLVLFDINLLINITCIILSFRNWPGMIFPICSVKSRKKSKTANISNKFSNFGRNKTLPTNLHSNNPSPSFDNNRIEKQFKNSLKYSPIKQPLENNARYSPIKQPFEDNPRYSTIKIDT